MAIKFEKIQPGMTLYDRHREKMGNTTISTIGEWAVKVLSVSPTEREAVVSWNGNPREVWFEHELRRLYDWSMNDPGVEVVRGIWDSVRSVKRPKAKKP